MPLLIATMSKNKFCPYPIFIQLGFESHPDLIILSEMPELDLKHYGTRIPESKSTPSFVKYYSLEGEQITRAIKEGNLAGNIGEICSSVCSIENFSKPIDSSCIPKLGPQRFAFGGLPILQFRRMQMGLSLYATSPDINDAKFMDTLIQFQYNVLLEKILEGSFNLGGSESTLSDYPDLTPKKYPKVLHPIIEKLFESQGYNSKLFDTAYVQETCEFFEKTLIKKDTSDDKQSKFSSFVNSFFKQKPSLAEVELYNFLVKEVWGVLKIKDTVRESLTDILPKELIGIAVEYLPVITSPVAKF